MVWKLLPWLGIAVVWTLPLVHGHLRRRTGVRWFSISGILAGGVLLGSGIDIPEGIENWSLDSYRCFGGAILFWIGVKKFYEDACSRLRQHPDFEANGDTKRGGWHVMVDDGDNAWNFCFPKAQSRPDALRLAAEESGIPWDGSV